MAKQAKAVGGRIHELRTGRGWNKAEMARRMPGLASGNDVGRWEKGQHLPRSDTLEAIAELLGTTVADLYAGPAAERPAKGPVPDLLGTLSGRDSDDRLAGIEEQLLHLRADVAELGVDVARDEAQRQKWRRRGRGEDSSEADG